MTGLITPLSPTSVNLLSRTPISFNERLKQSVASTPSPEDKKSTMADIPPSSPFQPHVGAASAAPSPDKFYTAKPGQRSPVKGFNIHCDDLEMLDDNMDEVEAAKDDFKIPDLPSRRPSEDTMKGFDLSLRDVPTAQDKKMDFMDDFNDDLSVCDEQTVLSEDTCFSTFSAVPNADMTQFANLGNRTANHILAEMTPRSQPSRTPATNRKQSMAPTPASSRRPAAKSRDNDTTSLLLDFTQQFENVPRPERPSPVKNNTEPYLLSYLNNQRSPGKNRPVTPGKRASVLNLLDFDLPPQATPRSIPTITVRELESLKSGYLSEISSLKASLSGREAEVESLKKAVSDAERRVGEALEEARDHKGAREHAEQGRIEWEKKGAEVESVMKSLKAEFLALEKEREDLLEKVENGNEKLANMTQQKNEADTNILELAAKLANNLGNGSSTTDSSAGDAAIEALVTQRVTSQLDAKMDGLARELHAVYKKKHETKVATLKKTYDARAEKKCAELQTKLDAMAAEKNSTQPTTADGGAGAGDGGGGGRQDAEAEAAKQAEAQQHAARIAGLTRQLDALMQTQSELLADLERERVEKGELVAAVDEMLALQVDAASTIGIGSGIGSGNGNGAEIGMETPARRVLSGVEDLRRSISRPVVGGRGGGPGESRIGRFGAPGGGVGASKSRMMSNIERMGGGGKGNE